MNRIKPFILLILDGWGYSPTWGGNAISTADTPNMDQYWSKFPHTTLSASGLSVGLPKNEMGNSEVGHLNIGAGRVIRQDVEIITKSIKDGKFFKNKALTDTFQYIRKNNSSLHLAGLISDGGIHSHIDHLYALLELACKYKIKSVFIHAFTDGRDSPPASALSFISKVIDKIKQLSFRGSDWKIATVSGRYYAMDRDRHWDRTEQVYNAMVLNQGPTAKGSLNCISHSYSQGKTDEFIIPTIIHDDNNPSPKISNNDAIIFFNFRPDRMRQLNHTFLNQRFKGFHRKKFPRNLYVVTMTPYEYEIEIPSHIIFPVPEKVTNVLSEVISNNGLKQLHIAETEKYAHVTYFFNGGREKPFSGEDRILVPSPRISTYDLKPEMSAKEVTQKIIQNLNKYDFMVVNYANADMVGHTGNLKAAIKAINTVDKCLKTVINSILENNGLAIICADHGNAEEMIDPATSEKDTEHTANPVPFIIISKSYNFKNLHQGKLANIAPTILDIMGLKKPVEMIENSLFEV